MALQAKLDSVNREHGDSYVVGIQPGLLSSLSLR